MADYTVTFGKRGNVTAQFEPKKTITLKNQAVDKTKLQDLNDVKKANGDSLQHGDILQYDSASNTFVYTSGALVRNANNDYVAIGRAIVPALGRNVDLGTKTNPFRSLFVQGNTISIGNVSLSDTGFGTITIVREVEPGNTVQFGTLSTISTANQMTIGTDEGNTEFDLSDGALQNFNSNTNVVTYLDSLNEALLNIHDDTFVRNVDFTATPTSAGAGTTIRVTITTEGNPNEYDIDWGDGTSDNNITDDTPSHVYSAGAIDSSPLTIKVVARNTSGSGAGSFSTKTRVNYITLFAKDPEPVFFIHSGLTAGSVITEANTGQAVYLQNDSREVPNTDVTATYSINWGDGNLEQIASKVSDGGDQGARLAHTYTSSSGSSSFTLTMNVETMSTATPGVLPLSNTYTLKVFDLNIAAPDNITDKTISWSTGSSGSSPALAYGFVANVNANTLSAGDSLNSSRPRVTSGSVTTATMGTYFHSNGSITAEFNDTAGVITPTVSESDVDYYNYNASGSGVSAAQRIYAPSLFETGHKATISVSVSSFDYGMNKVEFVTDEGNSNELQYLYDNLSVAPTVDVSSATVAHGSGSYNYISGVPYYNSGDSITLSGVTVTNLTGQAYYNGNAFTVGDTNVETLSGTSISNQSYNYSTALPSSDRNSSIPNANLSSTNIEDLTVNIGSGDNACRLTFTARNVNGSDVETITSPIINVFNGTDVVNESSISVASGLGQGYTTNGVRVTGFSGATPAYSSSTDYYVDNAWSGAETVAGTDEAIVRYGRLKHFATDLSSGYLPVGPDLATGRSGAQYFRFAFKRTAVSTFRVRLTGKVSGFYYALPGSDIDDSSTINGWIDASVQYAGSGIPGADTANGGNGSNGGAFTGGDRIIDGTTYNSSTFDLTFGTESTTNSYNNQVLIAIVLNSDDNITSISIEEAS